MQARMRNPAMLLTDAMSAILTLLKAASTPFFLVQAAMKERAS